MLGGKHGYLNWSNRLKKARYERLKEKLKLFELIKVKSDQESGVSICQRGGFQCLNFQELLLSPRLLTTVWLGLRHINTIQIKITFSRLIVLLKLVYNR
jgi:hypothetical protein